ncbi:hypothetical protein C8A00DRAFT_43197 [Chaetomidium leptoderma]|uniref:C3H1-type domain-containing protein n=1 Tax=Chaetomidium leptoderma TaxID=669021 RepID=A0AAN6VM95_9PEZI|nr:hypothetical protein C8A00DRAFT_43197 [Chaetomidium leptoderma]
MSYNYNPPPPAPPPAQSSGGPGGYPSYGPPRGGHSGRGRGGPDRGGYHQQPHPGYGYGQQPAYGPQNPAPYSGPPAQPGYPQPPQQQWHHDHGPHAPLPAHNYHPNYAPQIYQPQPAYGGQPQYQPAPQPPYGQPYPAPAPHSSPPAQQWGAHPQAPPTHGTYGGGGRGGRGGYSDRGGPKGQLMGPPIRMGFDGHNPQPAPAPVSAPYPYGGPPAPPAAYPAPYQGYPPPAPYMPPPPSFDGHSGHGSRHHGRGGFHQNKSRPHLGGDKNRGRNQNQNKGPAAHTAPSQHQKPDAASAGKKKKRKTNTLGLTPGDESDEDDENEEQRLNDMYGADAPNPKSSSEIDLWIAERRARFPTKSRIEARKAAAKAHNGDAHQDKSTALEQRAEKLRKQLERVESSIKRKREQQDEGDDMRGVALSASPSSDVKSDDEKPEVMSTRQEPNNVPPPPRKADPTKHCKYFSTGGTCGKRGKCRFVHDPAVREAALKERELNGGRMTLQQRLVLNDKDQEDLAIVETLKYLQDKGVITKKASGAEDSDDQFEEDTVTKGELPPAPVITQAGNGLPPIPPVTVSSDNNINNETKYSGWNLSGFGNTGVRPSE